MKSRLGAGVTCLAVSAAALCGAEASVPRKSIRACGWDIAHATVEEIHHNRAKFSGIGIDGIHFVPLGVWPDGSPMRESEFAFSTRRFRSADFSKQIPLMKEITATDGLGDSMFRVGFCVRKRVDWRDDEAWATVADNMTFLAELARDTGVKGFAIDEEDYYDARQFVRLEGEAPFHELAELARRRGREVFEAAFRANPTLEISSSWGFSTILKWAVYLTPSAGDDQMAVMEAFGELWPCFLNGVIEVMPPTARFHEGNEAKGYHGVAVKRDFEVGAWETSRGVLPQLAPSLRGRYLQRLAVSFGQYIDMYINPAPPKGNAFYYFAPKYGSRIKAFDENLTAALAAADRMIWVYGEKGTWIDWDFKGRKKTDRSYRYPTWEKQLPGFSRMLRIAKGDYAPLEDDIASGRAKNLIGNSACVSKDGKIPAPYRPYVDPRRKQEPSPFAWDAKEGARGAGCLRLLGRGCYTWITDKLLPGDEIYVKLRLKGCNPRAGVNWRTGDTNRWDMVHSVLARPFGSDGGKWIEVRKRLFVPEGVDGMMMTLGGKTERDAPNYFDDVEVYLIPRNAEGDRR